MSEPTPEPSPAQDPTPDPTPTSDSTDWKAEARKWEQRAKENIKAAEQLAALEEANKTELQKAQERAQKAEERAAQSELAALKVRIAAEMNVPVEVLHGTDEESIRAAGQKVLDWAGIAKKAPPKVTALKSGSTADDTSGMTGKQRAAAALRQMRNAD